MDDDAISISSDDSSPPTRRTLLEPVIKRVVDALGGYEGSTYRLGDSAHLCLSDLKKLWLRDADDDDRTVAHIFWECSVLPNDLVPILLATAGKVVAGESDKRAIRAADLCCAMTWPIDVAEELKELDDEDDLTRIDYTQLLQSHLVYKQALLRPGVLQALFAITLPPLSKPPKSRTARDIQIISVILHLVRNLLFIRSPPLSSSSSTTQAEYAGLQGKLIRELERTNFLELVLTLGANTDADEALGGLNTIVLEIVYLLVRGVRPAGLVGDLARVRSVFLIFCFVLSSVLIVL